METYDLKTEVVYFAKKNQRKDLYQIIMSFAANLLNSCLYTDVKETWHIFFIGLSTDNLW